MAERILVMLNMGYSLSKICSYSDMPSRSSVFEWLKDPDKKDFLDKYRFAREIQTEVVEDEIMDIVDYPLKVPLVAKDGTIIQVDGEIVWTIDNGAVQHARLRADYRHKHLQAMKPKLYGKHAGLGEEIKTGLLAKMEAARGRLAKFNEETGRTFDNKTGDQIDE